MDESKPASKPVSHDVQGSLCAPASNRELVWKGLIDRVRSGDQEALASLYDESSPLVYGLALRVLGNKADAEEVSLDVYKQIWRAAKDYDPSRASVQAWIVMLARTRSIDRQRQAATRTRLEQPMDDATNWRASQPGPEEQTASNEA